MFGVRRSSRTIAELKPLWQAKVDDHVIALNWSPDGLLLAAAAVSGPIQLLDGPTGQVRHTLPGHHFGTAALGFSHDGAHFASGGQDGKIRLWNQTTGQEMRALDAGADWVERVAWCPLENLLATSAGRKLRLWNAAGQLLQEYPDHGSTIADIQWQPGSRILASASYGCVALWSVEQTNPTRRFEWRGSQLVLAWSPDSKYLATGDQDCTVHFWIMRSGEDLQMSGYPRKVRELSWDATGRYLATGGGEVPCVWDFSGKGPAGTTPAQLQAHEFPVNALAYQHSGPLLASADADGLVALWRPQKSKKALGIAVSDTGATCLAWSPNDKWLAVGHDCGRIAVFPCP